MGNSREFNSKVNSNKRIRTFIYLRAKNIQGSIGDKVIDLKKRPVPISIRKHKENVNCEEFNKKFDKKKSLSPFFD